MSVALFLAVLVVFSSGASASCPGSARYRVSNNCRWTSKTHPTDYPSAAHFSPLCGTTHNARYNLFMRGGKATDGVKDVAELGEHDTLQSEIEECVDQGKCASTGYFRYPCDTSQNAPGVGNGVCSHSGMIKVSTAYPYVSMVSMIAPSPDWFVGRSGIDLCQPDPRTGKYAWVESYGPVDLFAYDAGTDAGPTFLSPDAPVTPREPISVFDGKDASNIFYNQDLGFWGCKAIVLATSVVDDLVILTMDMTTI